MSEDKDGFRAGGGAGGSDRLPPASYFRPAPGAKVPGDAPTAKQPAVKATTPKPPSGAPATKPPAPNASSATSARKPSSVSPAPKPPSGPRSSASSAPTTRLPDAPMGAPEGFNDDARTVLRPSPAAATAVVDSAPVAQPTTRAPKPPADVSKNPAEVLSAPTSRRTRKARLRLSRIDPWSMMKTAFLFSIAGFIISMVSVGVLWTVIEASGLLTDLNDFISTLVSTPSDPTPFDIHQYLNGAKVLGFTAVIGAIDIVLFTALGTLGAFLYNLSATMLGGLELTLAED